jgi:hypothetical protein
VRSITRICLCLTASISLAAACVGQEGSRPKKRRVKSQQRAAPQRQEEIRVPSLITSAPVPSPGEVRQVGQAEVRYYRDSNTTYVSAGSVVYEKSPVSMDLSFTFSVSGKEVVRPEAVTVALSTNGVAVFKEGAGLSVEADGKRFDFKPQPTSCFERQCVDVTALVEFATFEQIANSRSVKIRAERFAFELSENGREAMRDLLRSVESPLEKP